MISLFIFNHLTQKIYKDWENQGKKNKEKNLFHIL